MQITEVREREREKHWENASYLKYATKKLSIYFENLLKILKFEVAFLY